MHRLRAAGRTFAEIAAELGVTRNTVRRFVRAAGPDELLVRDGTGCRASALDAYEHYLRERWNSGCTNAVVLHQEIRERGYAGSARSVRRHLAAYRGARTVPERPPAPPKPAPSPAGS